MTLEIFSDLCDSMKSRFLEQLWLLPAAAPLSGSPSSYLAAAPARHCAGMQWAASSHSTAPRLFCKPSTKVWADTTRDKPGVRPKACISKGVYHSHPTTALTLVFRNRILEGIRMYFDWVGFEGCCEAVFAMDQNQLFGCKTRAKAAQAAAVYPAEGSGRKRKVRKGRNFPMLPYIWKTNICTLNGECI